MRKVLTIALIALLLFAGTGVIAVAGESPDTVSPGEKNDVADPFHKDEGSGVTDEGTDGVTPDNPISVGE